MTLFNRLCRALPAGSQNAWAGAKSRLGAFFVGLAFGAAGIAVLWSGTLHPILKVQSAAGWLETSAQVLESKLDDNQEEFSILYRYEVNGKTYQSDQFNPTDSKRNYATQSMLEAHHAYPVGKIITIRVNPDNHGEAIVEHSIHPTAWIGLLFPIPFLTVGFCGIIWALFGGRVHSRSLQLREQVARQAEQAGCHHIARRLRDPAPPDDESILFLDGDDRLAGLGSLAVCLFVNGIVGTFVLLMILMFASGEAMAILLFFFLLPFEWIGIGLLLNTLRWLGGQRAPDYLFLANPVSPHPGPMQIQTQWLFLGKPNQTSRYQKCELNVTRGSVHQAYSWFKKKKQMARLEPNTAFISITRQPDNLSGKQQFVIPPEIKPDFRGNYQGAISLTIRWKQRGEKPQIREFVLGQTEND